MTQGYNQLNLFDTPIGQVKDANKAINMAKATRGAVKTGISYAPYIGDIYDMGEGLYQATHGHPFVGSGQALLGAGGLAANILFPSSGALAKAGVKAGIKKGAKALAYLSPNIARGVRNYAKFNRSGLGQGLTAGVPEVFYSLPDMLNQTDGNNADSNIINTGTSTGDNNAKGGTRLGGQPTTQQQALALAQQLGGNPPVANQQDADTQQANIQAINDYIAKLQEANRPYTDVLQNYYNNYNKYLNDYHRARDFYTGLAGWSGNNLWAEVGKDYNTVANEANKLAIAKQLQDNEINNLNAINEMVGNLAMAQEMGLPPEAAFANKNLLTMMAARDREANRYQIALENNLMKKYGIDRNYARALTVQAMRGQNALDVASMYTGAYGNGGGVAPGLNQRGTASNAPASYDVMLQAAHNKNNR